MSDLLPKCDSPMLEMPYPPQIKRYYLNYSYLFLVKTKYLNSNSSFLQIMMLDLKDKKILYELSKNCRLPTSQIAKRVGLSQQVVDYRIQRFIKNHLITDFITEVNLEKLGFHRHILYLQLKNVNEQKEREILNYLIHHPFLTWITTSTGRWSIILDVIAKDLVHASHIVEEIKSKYHHFLDETKIISQLSYHYFHSKYYSFSYPFPHKKLKKQTKAISLDSLDLKLLSLLCNNAKLSFVQLSPLLHLTSNAVKNRLKKLIDQEVIKNFTIAPDKTKLGYEQYDIQFTFEQTNKEKEQRLIHYLYSHPNINFYYKPLGPWDLEVGIFVRNPGELRKILLEMRTSFPDLIKIYDTVLFYEEPKSNRVPEGVFAEARSISSTKS